MRQLRVMVAGLVIALAGQGAALADTSPAGTVTLDGVLVALQPGTTEVVTVKHTTGWHARVTLWSLSSTGWQPLAQAADGRTGYGGLVVGDQRRQGTGATPLGSYQLLDTFGRHPAAAGWRMPYRRIHRGDYWVEDNASPFYNRFRNRSQGGFRWWLRRGENTSEKLSQYAGRQYEYVVNTGFNVDQVRHRGAGIFLHVNGRGATAGCISAPRWFLQTVLADLDPQQVPVIAIGR